MNKLEMLKVEITKIRKDSVHNCLAKWLESGNVSIMLMFVAGCLEYMDKEDKDFESLSKIKELLI